jgi:hypothetical protein
VAFTTHTLLRTQLPLAFHDCTHAEPNRDVGDSAQHGGGRDNLQCGSCLHGTKRRHIIPQCSGSHQDRRQPRCTLSSHDQLPQHCSLANINHSDRHMHSAGPWLLCADSDPGAHNWHTCNRHQQHHHHCPGTCTPHVLSTVSACCSMCTTGKHAVVQPSFAVTQPLTELTCCCCSWIYHATLSHAGSLHYLYHPKLSNC